MYGLFVTNIVGSVLMLLYLIWHLEQTNRKLTSFFQSIEFDDFSTRFSKGNQASPLFRALNDQINWVLQRYRESRREKEEYISFLNTVVEHVGVGLLAYDQFGNIKLFNRACCKLLDLPRMGKLDKFKNSHPQLYLKITDLNDSSVFQFKISNKVNLLIYSTNFNLKGKDFKIVALQNIHSELQKNETEAWQNLARVLRHEMLNSLAPISSLLGSAIYILNQNEHNELPSAIEALETAEKRSKSLMKFVEAYRSFTTLPDPNIQAIELNRLFSSVEKLLVQEAKDTKFFFQFNSNNLVIHADSQLIENTLINLIKNAIESFQADCAGQIKLEAVTGQSENKNFVILKVGNDGAEIPEDIRTKIFIPFYSTKKGGTGIGLSLARQIMQQHGGAIELESSKGWTEFRLVFPISGLGHSSQEPRVKWKL